MAFWHRIRQKPRAAEHHPRERQSDADGVVKERWILDTLTTRLMTLFILVLAIPMISLASFTTGQLREAQADESQKAIRLTYQLFQETLQSQSRDLSLLTLPKRSSHGVLNLGGSYGKDWGGQCATQTGMVCGWFDSKTEMAHLYGVDKVTAAAKPSANHTAVTELDIPAPALKSALQQLSTSGLFGLAAKEHKTSLSQILQIGEAWYLLSFRIPLDLQGRVLQGGEVTFVGKPLNREWLSQFYQRYRFLNTSLALLPTNGVFPASEKLILGGMNNSVHALLFGQEYSANSGKLWYISSVLSHLNNNTGIEPSALHNHSGIYYRTYPVMGQMGELSLKPVLQLLIAMPPDEQMGYMGRYAIGFYVILLMGLLLSATLAVLASRMITRPMFKLVDEVNTLSRSDDLDAGQVTAIGFMEINRLSKAFNRMLSRLRQENKLKLDFIATLTHDLKVPLLAEMQTLSYLSRESYGALSQDQREVIATMELSNRMTLRLVNDLLEVNRYDSGRVVLRLEPVDVKVLLEEVIQACQSLAKEKNIALSCQMMCEETTLHADRLEIQRVLNNLISNAIQNTPRAGKVICEVMDEGVWPDQKLTKTGAYEYTTLTAPLNPSGCLLVSVRDSGIGIPKNELPNLFHRFGALNRGRSPMSTGLGLYNCYQVARAHHGAIWIESTEGQGTAVNMLLPTTQSAYQERRRQRDRRHQ